MSKPKRATRNKTTAKPPCGSVPTLSSASGVKVGKKQGSKRKSNSLPVAPLVRSRGLHQQKVDKVDIPRPTEWLHHQAQFNARLRRNAQDSVELLSPQKRSQRPTSDDGRPVKRPRAKAEMGSTIHHILLEGSATVAKTQKKNRAARAICGGDVLPWGAWPIRLRNHGGQSFYERVGGDYPREYDSPRAPYWTGGDRVGGSGSVCGIGGVSEDTIHDELLRRLPPVFSCYSSSTYHRGCNTAAEASHNDDESTVKRLVPDKCGRWVVAISPRTHVAPAAAAAVPAAATATATATAADVASTDDNSDSCAGSGSGSGSGSPDPAAAPVSRVTRMVPGWYGGWVEVEMSPASGTNYEQRKRRVATAKSGPDALASTIEACKAMKARPQAVERGLSTAEDKREEGAVGVGGGAEGRGRGAQGGREKKTSSNGGGDGYEQVGSDGEEACSWQGWTVSEPAKETVRRVWGRARRRGLDTCEPRLRERVRRTSPAPIENPVESKGGKTRRRTRKKIGADAVGERSAADGSTTESDVCDDIATADEHDTGADENATSAAGGGVQDRLDPGLLSCLGRECEGVIDATLHVVLSEQLSQSTLKSTSKESPAEAADWQDVFRTMYSCSADARRVAHGGAAQRATGVGAKEEEPDTTATRRGVAKGMRGAVWGAGDASDGAVVVVNERLPALPLNEAVFTRAYNRMMLYLHDNKSWQT